MIFYENSPIDETLISAAKTRDEEAIKQALTNGANPNCLVEIQEGNKHVRLYDFCKNIKGKKGKKILSLLAEAGGLSEKARAQRKISSHHTYPKKVANSRRQYRTRIDKEIKERNARLRSE